MKQRKINRAFLRLGSKLFSNTAFFQNRQKRLWDRLINTLSYVIFDLESDGTRIHEFAFHTEDTTKSYKGERELDVLLDALNKPPIIVGHNIKERDLKILEKRGYNSKAFVWDTLRIELILNPCRFSYALRTDHNAAADTELTHRLFWNQVQRLAADKALLRQLAAMLPEFLYLFLEQMGNSLFLLPQQGETEAEAFFHTLRDVDEKVVEHLERISGSLKNEKVLIVAPKRIWGWISRYINLSFPFSGNELEFMALRAILFKNNP